MQEDESAGEFQASILYVTRLSRQLYPVLVAGNDGCYCLAECPIFAVVYQIARHRHQNLK